MKALEKAMKRELRHVLPSGAMQLRTKRTAM
jgi:hypothetical protein